MKKNLKGMQEDKVNSSMDALDEIFGERGMSWIVASAII
jgi:hypothetical protein